MIGPVDNGDRIIAKKGARSVVSGKERMSDELVESPIKRGCNDPTHHPLLLQVVSVPGSHP